jgi:hypothetical protein
MRSISPYENLSLVCRCSSRRNQTSSNRTDAFNQWKGVASINARERSWRGKGSPRPSRITSAAGEPATTFPTKRDQVRVLERQVVRRIPIWTSRPEGKFQLIEVVLGQSLDLWKRVTGCAGMVRESLKAVRVIARGGLRGEDSSK